MNNKMEEKNNNYNNNNPLSLNEENLLKDAMIFLQEEYNIKKEKLNILKQELSQTKKQFQNQLQEYQKETKLTIDKEKTFALSPFQPQELVKAVKELINRDKIKK